MIGAIQIAICLLGIQAAWGSEVRFLRVPGEGIQPQAVTAPDGTIHLLYFEGDPYGGDVYYTTMATDSTAWASPVKVNSIPGSAIAAGTVRGPHMALGVGSRPHVAWMGSKDEPKGQRPMYYTRMRLDKSAFEDQRDVIHTAYGLDGGGTVSANGSGRVHVVWHAGHGGEDARRVYVAESNDRGETFSKEVEISDPALGSCACCGIRSATGADGTCYVLYRTAREGVHRDAHLIVYGGPDVKEVKVHPWELGACPMSTASLKADSTSVRVAWETDGEVYFALYDRSGTRLAAPHRPSGEGGARKHPVLAINSAGQTLLAWTDGTGWNRGGTFAWQVFDRDGRPTDLHGSGDGIPVWSVVAAATDSKGRFVLIH